MKRSVAITGRTPAFLQWAIEFVCPLRDPDHERLASSTFRQLRGLRELSHCQIEGRVVEGVCLHPDATVSTSETALGFSAAEIADPFGGLEFVTTCCQGCPANAGSEQPSNLLAGCFGWVSVDLQTNFEQVVRGRSMPEANLSKGSQESAISVALDQTLAHFADRAMLEEHYWVTSPVWYGFWSQSPISPTAASVLLPLFSKLLRNVEMLPGKKSGDLTRFIDALQRCQQHGLNLHVELVPGGFSDGTTWTLNGHCRFCKYERRAGTSGEACPCCGQSGTWQNAIKSKVLGLRPYMNLQSIFGATETKRLLSAWRERTLPQE